jgi:WD40 repeat protein
VTKTLMSVLFASITAALAGPAGAQEPKQRVELKGYMSAVTAVAINRDGTLVAAGGSDGTIRCWQVKTAQPLPDSFHHALKVNSLAYSPDGQYLASGSVDGTARLWGPGGIDHWMSGVKSKAHDGWNVAAAAFSPDGKTVASVGWDGTAKLWEVSTGKEQASFKIGMSAYAIAFSGDGKLLALAGSDGRQGTLQMLQVATGQLQPLYSQPDTIVTCLAFSPDGKTLAFAGETLPPVLPKGSFSSVPPKTIMPQDHAIQLWDPAARKPQGTLHGHNDTVRCLAFCPDGTLISGGRDGALVVWDVNTRQARATVKKDRDVYCLAVSRDGTLLVTGGGNLGVGAGDCGRVRFWDMPGRKN